MFTPNNPQPKTEIKAKYITDIEKYLVNVVTIQDSQGTIISGVANLKLPNYFTLSGATSGGIAINEVELNLNIPASGITLTDFQAMSGSIINGDSVQLALEKLQYQINNSSSGGFDGITGQIQSLSGDVGVLQSNLSDLTFVVNQNTQNISSLKTITGLINTDTQTALTDANLANTKIFTLTGQVNQLQTITGDINNSITNIANSYVKTINDLSGVVNLTTTNINEGNNLYFTTGRVLNTPITGLTSATGLLQPGDTLTTSLTKLQKQITGSVISNLNQVPAPTGNYGMNNKAFTGLNGDNGSTTLGLAGNFFNVRNPSSDSFISIWTNGKTAVGHLAGAGGSSYTVAIGAGAVGTTVSNPANIVGIGNNALYSNSSSYLTSVGHYALFDNNINSSANVGNSAFGYYALNINNGYYNSFFGAYAAGNNSKLIGSATGFRNNGFGYGTLYKVTTGAGNNAIGAEAGYEATTASGNIYLGNRAGLPGTGVSGAVTTGSNNIFIGDRTRFIDNTQLSGVILIGHGLRAQNNNETIIGYEANGGQINQLRITETAKMENNDRRVTKYNYLTTTGTSTTTIETIPTDVGKVYLITAKIIASSGSLNGGVTEVKAGVKNTSGTATVINSSDTLPFILDLDLTGISVSITASGSDILVRVTGLVGTIKWHSVVEIIELL